MFSSYTAIGDSFTEGMGDELPDGAVRGWADFVAIGLSQASVAAGAGPIGYANLAIRGRKLGPLLAEQLPPAIAMRPALLSLNGGGNDIMRPKVLIDDVAEQLVQAARQAADAGIHVLLLSGANPGKHLPMGAVMNRRGDELAEAVTKRFPIENMTYVDNWSDQELTRIEYWSSDKLHLNALGHARVAGNVLRGLGVEVPAGWGIDEAAISRANARNNLGYYRDYVVPWIGRRLTGRSSGDGRAPKRASLLPVVVEATGATGTGA
ncbi:SGNH/GDSL hydrolase family protein [Microterricola pindariensis]|uniref:GDSL family lipase n=1 Tax=Microterricola pindariensis TaxID=478010 RepID=A0ABX5AZP3_9MICO|nr:SGNH/GDSL hydrolase family protein [Microterricola pindariensis]PPL20400.1 GDSL family lipase [Microterricola pindariensis]